MKKIYFDCTHCEAKRYIIILEENAFYLRGNCPICRNKITINKKMLDIAIAKKLKKSN